ncbi:acyl carrier protein, partial [Vibrio parahaemolyticus]
QYNIVIDADDSNTREHFASVANLAKYVSSQTNE